MSQGNRAEPTHPKQLRMNPKPRSVFFGLLLLTAAPAHAMRCGNLLVLEGNYTFEVLEKCGPPQYRDERVEYRGIRLRGAIELSEYEPVKIEEWVYNLGPQMFMQQLIFENGRLVKIKHLHRGQ